MVPDQELKQIESRVSRTEQAVESLGDQFHVLQKDFKDSESRIIDEIGKLSEKQSSVGKVSWSLVVSVASSITVAVAAIVGWGMKTQETAAVNKAVADERHKFTMQIFEEEKDDQDKELDRRIKIYLEKNLD